MAEEELDLDFNLRWIMVALARRDKALRETEGHNRHPTIDAINKWIKVPRGSAYCLSALIKQCAQALCDHFEIRNPIPKEPSTQRFWQKVPDKYRVAIGKAKKGDWGFMRNRAQPALGHAFIFTEDETHIQQTFEYNTNKAGASDGEGCHELVRTKEGSSRLEYLGAVNVIQWIIDENPDLA
jgi:hypothetical protein